MHQETSASALNFDCTGNLKKCFICRKSLNTKHDYDCENKSDFIYKSDNPSLCKLFLTLAFRYIKFESSDVHLHQTLNLNLKSGHSQNETIPENAELCCKMCEPLLSTFCELYDQLTLVKLHINDNLEKIVNLIESYNGDPKDHKDERQGQDFWSGSWRKPFVTKVHSKCKKFPLLKLTKIKPKSKTDHQYNLVAENDDDHQLDNVDPLQILDSPPEKVNSHHHDGDVQQLEASNRDLVPTSIDKPHKCPYCSKSFFHLRNLFRHETSSHLELLGKEKSCFKFRCPHCLMGFVQYINLTKHLTREHGLTLAKDQEMSNVSNNQTSKNESFDKPFECQYCPKSFNHKSNLALHQALCHNETSCQDSRLFKCSQCEKSFLRRDILAKHQAENHAVENSTLNTNPMTSETESSEDEFELSVGRTNNHKIPNSVNQNSITRRTTQTQHPQRRYIKIAPKKPPTETEGNEKDSAIANQNSHYIPLTRPPTETQSPYSSYIHIPSYQGGIESPVPRKVIQRRRRATKIIGESHCRKLLVTDLQKLDESDKHQQTFTQAISVSVMLPNTSRSVPAGTNNLNETIMEVDEGQVFQAKTEKMHVENGNVEVDDKTENHGDNFILPD